MGKKKNIIKEKSKDKKISSEPNDGYWDNVKKEFEKLSQDDKLTFADSDKDMPPSKDLSNKGERDLVIFYNKLESIILGPQPTSEVFKKLAISLQDIFDSNYVEFFSLGDGFLRYEYISVPAWMLKISHKLLKIAPLLGMEVPLFEGSFFTEFVEKCEPREIITHDDLLHSIRDFVPPTTEHNIYIRETFPEIAVKFFGYRYIFQTPLIINGNMFGYFSFLQKERFTERTRMEIILLADKIGDLLAQRKREEELPELLTSMNKGFVVLEAILDKKKNPLDFNIRSINKWLLENIPYKQEEYVGKNVFTLLPDLQENFIEQFNHVYKKDNAQIFEWSFKTFPMLVRIFLYKLGSGRIAAQIEDITEQKLKEAEITYMAQHDQMTALFNRLTFDTLVKQEIKNSRRDNQKFALYFIDLNDFKTINDTYGHDVGDIVLIRVAGFIRSALREFDIVARCGGDEFNILARKVETNDNGELIKRKLCESIAQPIYINDKLTITPSASIGFSIFADDGEDYDQLRKKSDQRMYSAKKTKV